MATNYETFEYDVLVIGAGGAGLRAAIEASAAGVKVGLICKSLLGKAHTVMAEGGMAAAMGNVDDRDNWKVHFADTMRGGQYVNNWRKGELHAQEAPGRVPEIETWGAVFDRTKDGKILQRNFGGHRYARLAHVGDRTGLELIRTLQDHGIHQGITVHMEWTIVTLLKDGNRVVGALGYDRERGRFKILKEKAMVLSTGGLGRPYRITTNSWEGTGDGQSLAYHAGAELVDMEFLQFHPTGMVWPLSVQGLLITEAVRGEGGVLRNKDGKRFMFGDIPDNYKSQTSDDPEEGWRYVMGDKNAKRPPELLTRDHVARCIMREVKAGRGSPHGGVFLDIAWIKEKIPNAAEHIKKKLPSMYHQFHELVIHGREVFLDVLRRVRGFFLYPSAVEKDAAVRAAATGLHFAHDAAGDVVARQQFRRTLGVFVAHHIAPAFFGIVRGLGFVIVRNVAKHEALAVLVPQHAAFAAHGFGDQQPLHTQRPDHASRVKLQEFHVHQLRAGVIRERLPVARAFPGIGRDPVGAAEAAGGQHHRLRFENFEPSPLAVVAERAHDTVAVLEQRDNRPFHVDGDALMNAVILQGADQFQAGAVADVGRSE